MRTVKDAIETFVKNREPVTTYNLDLWIDYMFYCNYDRNSDGDTMDNSQSFDQATVRQMMKEAFECGLENR